MCIRDRFRAFVVLTVSDAVRSDPRSDRWNRKNDPAEDDVGGVSVYRDQCYDCLLYTSRCV